MIAIVVQPGVEFDHSNIIHYQAQEAQALAQWIEKTKMVYEAHSTDYQTQTAYRELVRDHFAILKVGPALTFALREAIFALAQIEQELIAPENRSRCLAVIEEVMLDEPQYWKNIIARVLTIHCWIFVTACRIVFVITGIAGLKIASKR